jgi:secreted PhoX family phosphatase
VLENVAEGSGESGLESPDNVTVSPSGELYLAEDGGGDQYLRGISKTGRVFDVARNAGSGGELAGVCFSPDGRALFVNLQREGLTLVITGPFAELARSHT